MLWLALAVVGGPASLAEELLSGATIERPRQSLERELERLEGRDEVDPLTRRRLRDALRQLPSGPERRRGERTLRSLPEADALVDTPSGELSPRLPPSNLPSSLPSEGIGR